MISQKRRKREELYDPSLEEEKKPLVIWPRKTRGLILDYLKQQGEATAKNKIKKGIF